MNQLLARAYPSLPGGAGASPGRAQSIRSPLSLDSQVTRSGPRVVEANLDPKKDLDRQLRVQCEALIMSTTKAVVEPLLSFITKARNV